MLWNKLIGAGPSMSGIKYVGGYTLGFLGQTTDITVNFNGNLVGGGGISAIPGDLVIIYFGTASSADRNLTISGYTELVELFSSDDIDTNLVVAYKFMGSTPDSSFILTGGTQSIDDGGVVAVQVWRNVNSTTPFDVAHVTAIGSNTVLCTPPAITPISAGSYIISGGVGSHSRGVRTYSSLDLNGFISIGSGNDVYDATVGLGYKQWISGSFNPAQFTFSEDDQLTSSWASVTLALRPA